MFKVLSVGAETVEIVDEHGIHRGVNKLMLDCDLEERRVVDARAYLKKEAKR